MPEDINGEANLDRVQVILYLDFSEESDKALQVAFEVAEELIEKNIFVEVEPIHMWNFNLFDSFTPDLPQVFINGKLMFIGRAPGREELINAILDRLGKSRRIIEVEGLTFNEVDEGFREVEVVQ